MTRKHLDFVSCALHPPVSDLFLRVFHACHVLPLLTHCSSQVRAICVEDAEHQVTFENNQGRSLRVWWSCVQFHKTFRPI